ncbi:MAG: 16S rRNA (cytosine(967)-C(5))-methyltransferase RsmB [Halioglobus sp.]|nr:16S rRNA (cytosine(967)-C(5))-methyltransferase RsmB [Halioglobus sp.]
MNADVRATAARVIGAVIGGASLNQVLPEKLDDVSERDRALLQQLSYGTLRQSPRLQAILTQLLDKPLRDKDRDVQGLLLCGLYQLDSTRVPDHAAVAATVDATRALKKHWAKGMTNAVLRRYLREREQLTQALDEAATASHPAWLFQKILAQWPAAAAAIIDANNQHPPMTLRVNRGQASRGDYLSSLKGHGIGAKAGNLSKHAIQLAVPIDVWDLPEFSTGRVSVQDEAAQMAALLLQAGAGERVLDACAAPGGKTCHILELQPELAELVAMDIDELRLQKVSENLQRLNLKATLITGDAARPPAGLEPASFDRILVDAPCSASGVVRRHPDVKLLRRESDIAPLAEQQLCILRGLWPLLKAGGTLLYATCSILDEENSQVIQRFLTEENDAALSDTEMTGSESVASGRQLLPSSGGTDGLFYATLKKAG